MSAARAARRAGRNLLIALLIGALIIVAIVIAYIAGRNTSTPIAEPTSSSVVNSSPPTAASETADAAPTGCLGGEQRNVAMLLSAQRAAPHTSFGAVDVASAFLRWAYRFPYPSTAEAAQVSDHIVSPEASAGFRNVAASYKSTSDITGGQVPKQTAFYLSTTTASWVVSKQSTPNRVTVEIGAPYVIKGAVSSTKSAAISATLVWGSNGWELLSEQAPDTSALAAGGTQFTAGC